MKMEILFYIHILAIVILLFFYKLYRVELNDDIYVYYNGPKYHYVVTNKYDIKKQVRQVLWIQKLKNI